MSIIQIRHAKREGAPLVIGIAGQSGDGKTYSALQLALGMANGDAGKVGLLDTENRRGSLYAGILGEPFLIADLIPPFSPTRYAQAIQEFQQAGIDVLVIDSVTHEWEGDGGCEDIADDGGKIANWKRAKFEHKKFIRAMLQCDMHVVACIRAREKTDFRNPKQPVSLGIQPICEKNFMYEMTASVLLEQAGQRRRILKCPQELLPIFGREGYITADDGRKLREWVSGADGSEAIERLRQRLIGAASEGMESLKRAWQAITPEQKQEVGGKDFLETLKASAAAIDQQSESNIPDELIDSLQAMKEAGTLEDLQEIWSEVQDPVLEPHYARLLEELK